MVTEKTLGRRMEQLRIREGIDRFALANLMGVTYQAIWSWETNHSFPKLNCLMRFANALGIDLREVLDL